MKSERKRRGMSPTDGWEWSLEWNWIMEKATKLFRWGIKWKQKFSQLLNYKFFVPSQLSHRLKSIRDVMKMKYRKSISLEQIASSIKKTFPLLARFTFWSPCCCVSNFKPLSSLKLMMKTSIVGVRTWPNELERSGVLLFNLLCFISRHHHHHRWRSSHVFRIIKATKLL